MTALGESGRGAPGQRTAGEPARRVPAERTAGQSVRRVPAQRTAGQSALGASAQRTAPVALRGARMALGARVLWDGLDLTISPGEFVAVLGPNGSGKTTLLKVLLGQRRLSAGTVRVAGAEPGRSGRIGRSGRRGRADAQPGSRGRAGTAIGYIPQQRAMELDLPLRGRDLVGLGLDGHRLGPRLGTRRTRAARAQRIEAALAAVDATGYADLPVGRLSGGEQQRLRVAQSLVGDPAVLLCDEPLLSLDPANQRVVTGLIDRRRTEADTAVLFVTHEINPILPMVDRVLHLVDGRFRIGTPEEVMTSQVLSELYRTDVEVLRIRDRLVVVGADAATDCHPDPA